MVIGDMPPLPASLEGTLGPRGPFCMPLRMSSKPMVRLPSLPVSSRPRHNLVSAYDGYKARVIADSVLGLVRADVGLLGDLALAQIDPTTSVNGDDVAATSSMRSPAAPKSCTNSSRVRSRPPVMTIMVASL